jgi:hypothetical protein
MGNGGGRLSHYLGLLATTLGHHDEAEHHFAEEGLQRAKKHGFRVLEHRSAELRDAAAKGRE